MEWLRQMSLKKAFLCITILFLLIALAFSVLSVMAIGRINKQNGYSIEVKIGQGIVLPENSPKTNTSFLDNTLMILQLILPVIFVIAGLLTANLVFYRIKLKQPLTLLQAGAEKIMDNNLDFIIQSDSNDELGQLCNSFEKMRVQLLENNRELWRQMEERKRLNAAFSHDLRNPVTVLKGSVKLLRKRLSNNALTTQNIEESISLIEEYAARIEKYIEAMSGVQRLEQLQFSPEKIYYETVVKDLKDSIHLLTMDSGIEAEVEAEDIFEWQKSVLLDKAMLFNIAENLIANAIRFAKAKIRVSIKLEEKMLVLSVQDDGPGFSQDILKKGAEPFLRGDKGNEKGTHFGMGLYICRLLCEKHNGSLELQNTNDGALATARLKVL
ncbi:MULTISPECIES: sensor histidine kinase [Acetivibrio]|uniref:histidine kinase n=1 Tax=Acetivibrio saccincola TaxID=1677857 RepID=A0A2S8R9I3_9FIRM|nr:MULTISPECIES: HAMP domain-containing sensor histidine kinase [Acetivibrio]PQQ66444.1 hypothetical protein B9R14_06540 [Acetivibrio saccincola]UWV46354.1 HAMP domain-containing histidine kinase [Acetivibrio thermocellus]